MISVFLINKLEGNMALTQQEQLQHLVNQIQLPEEIHSFFSNGKLTQVVVSKQSKTWTFQVALDNILPANVLMQFRQHLQTAFTNIARTALVIKTPVQAVDDELVNQYWHLSLIHI